jgi:hypothetical protein
MGFQSVKEMGLRELRKKHRPEIIAAMEERSKDRNSWKDKKGLATKLYSFKHDLSSVCPQVDSKEGADGLQVNGDSGSTTLENYLTSSALENELDEGIDLQEQVKKISSTDFFFSLGMRKREVLFIIYINGLMVEIW